MGAIIVCAPQSMYVQNKCPFMVHLWYFIFCWNMRFNSCSMSTLHIGLTSCLLSILLSAPIATSFFYSYSRVQAEFFLIEMQANTHSKFIARQQQINGVPWLKPIKTCTFQPFKRIKLIEVVIICIRLRLFYGHFWLLFFCYVRKLLYFFFVLIFDIQTLHSLSLLFLAKSLVFRGHWNINKFRANTKYEHSMRFFCRCLLECSVWHPVIKFESD